MHCADSAADQAGFGVRRMPQPAGKSRRISAPRRKMFVAARTLSNAGGTLGGGGPATQARMILDRPVLAFPVAFRVSTISLECLTIHG